MAENAVLKSIILIFSMPFLFIAIVVSCFDLWGIDKDIEKCFKVIDTYKNTEVSEYLWRALIIAEDRRNCYHKGIDPIAMIRAIFMRITKNEFQGASTIEQQFVRVVSGRYERTLSRKLREQILAVSVSKKFSKYQIAKAYLCIAFYGSGKIGIQGIHEMVSPKSISNIDFVQAIPVISRLKYPEPLREKTEWSIKHSCRNSHIRNLISNK